MPDDTENQTEAQAAPDDGADLATQLEAARAQAAAATAAYRTKALELEPDLPGELVAGDTIEAIDASLGRARTIVEGVRARVAPVNTTGARPETIAQPATSIPTSAGGSARTPLTIDTSNMSPTEKIAAGLAARRR